MFIRSDQWSLTTYDFMWFLWLNFTSSINRKRARNGDERKSLPFERYHNRFVNYTINEPRPGQAKPQKGTRRKRNTYGKTHIFCCNLCMKSTKDVFFLLFWACVPVLAIGNINREIHSKRHSCVWFNIIITIMMMRMHISFCNAYTNIQQRNDFSFFRFNVLKYGKKSNQPRTATHC